MDDKTDAEWVHEAELLELAIQQENAAWQAQDLHLGMININAYLVQVKVNTILTLFNELDVSQEKMQAIFKKELLDQMQRDRAMLIEHRLEQSKMAVVKNPLLGPDGRPIG